MDIRRFAVAVFAAASVGCAMNPPPGRYDLVYVEPRPPAERVEVIEVRPGPGFVWQRGYWAWEQSAYNWVPGHWARVPRAHARWIDGRWHSARQGWYWAPGHWR